MDVFAWAQAQFWSAPLPDLRLRRRLVEVAAGIRANPCGTLPRALMDKAALKGAYRLFAHPDVTHEALLAPHCARTRQSCQEPGAFLLLEDTTALSFTQRSEVAGMGPLTNETSQGFLAHTCLATRIEAWDDAHRPQLTLSGIFAQECWVREMPQGSRQERKRAKRASDCRVSESDRWARALHRAGGPPEHTQWTLVADRECDIFAVLVQSAAKGVDWVVRAAQPRKTTLGSQTIFEAAAQAEVIGTFTLPLRARPGVAARNATMALRAISTQINGPHDSQERHAPLSTGLVEAREVAPPPGMEGIHWLLLTSWPCQTYPQARRVANAYACRWLIEEYHKALKTGTKIEESQLSSAGRLQALLAIHAVIAAELLQLKLLGTTLGDQAVDEQSIPPEILAVLEARQGRPDKGWTNKTLLSAIARMGGYLARKNDGPPGWLSIWRGYLKLADMAQGYLLAIELKRCG